MLYQVYVVCYTSAAGNTGEGCGNVQQAKTKLEIVIQNERPASSAEWQVKPSAALVHATGPGWNHMDTCRSANYGVWWTNENMHLNYLVFMAKCSPVHCSVRIRMIPKECHINSWGARGFWAYTKFQLECT